MSIKYEFDLHLDELGAKVEALLVPSAMKAMEMVRAEVATQTPIETGNMVGSEEVRPIDSGAEIYIPGPYSRRQHFTLDYHHNVGNALFLEIPMVTKAEEALQMVADDIQAVT